MPESEARHSGACPLLGDSEAAGASTSESDSDRGRQQPLTSAPSLGRVGQRQHTTGRQVHITGRQHIAGRQHITVGFESITSTLLLQWSAGAAGAAAGARPQSGCGAVRRGAADAGEPAAYGVLPGRLRGPSRRLTARAAARAVPEPSCRSCCPPRPLARAPGCRRTPRAEDGAITPVRAEDGAITPVRNGAITLHYITLYFGFVSSESFAGGRPGPASSETAHGGPRTPPRPRPGSRTFRPAPAARSPRQSLPIDSLRRRRRTTSDHIRVAPAL